MRLTSLTLTNFRNHKELKCTLPEGALYISGENGTGKTALIEAVFLLFTSRSFRSQSIPEIRSFNEPFLRVAADFEGSIFNKVLLFYDTTKKFLVDGAEYDFTGFSHSLPLITYSPEYEGFFSDTHKERRAFIDRMIFYLDSTHVNYVKKYNALLARKRAELALDKPNQELLSILTASMLPLSETISLRRSTFLKDINGSFVNSSGEELFMQDMSLALQISSLADRELEAEIKAAKPLYGCHKDLVYLKEGSKVMEKFRSFGQKKSALLFLLYHTTKLLAKYKRKHLILLDDFEAGLDEKRITLLSELFNETKSQLIMTGLKKRPGFETLTLK